MKISLDSKYGKFASKVKSPQVVLASGDSVWASFESKLIQVGISPSEARMIATQRYHSLIASCTNREQGLD